MTQVFARSRSIQTGTFATPVFEAGEGPPLLLLHGNPDTHDVWEPLVARLADRHHCLAPDLPGFGGSAAPRDFDCSLDGHAAWVLQLVDGLALDRVHLAIHDVGATYGMAFASLHADRLASLTIFNGTFFPDYRWHFWARVWRTPGLGEAAMAIANRPLFVREMRRGGPHVPVEYARHAWSQFTWRTRRNVLRWYRAMDPDMYRGWDVRLLAAIGKTRAQVLWGDRDPFIPVATAERFGAPVQHFAESGHWVMQEAPDDAARAIAALVAASPA
ncbi:MAG TPA: alpha/beta fold hydrolase [Kofleriaceae bacterium]|nr:alpha/beta fold hydrolase [Kofleriaceae bacterium]